jgi:parallel beta-helix repeat protein
MVSRCNLLVVPVLTVLVLTFTISGSSKYQAYGSNVIVISADGTGGDCTSIGNWSAATRTCKLAADLYDTSIQIGGDRITLDGNGHTLQGSNDGFGVFLEQRMGVTIKNLDIHHFQVGIRLASSDGNVIFGNDVTNNLDAIELEYSDDNSLTGNNASSTADSGITLLYSNDNELRGNTASYNDFGIRLDFSNGNILRDNDVTNNSVGINISLSNGNLIKDNTASTNGNGIILNDSDGNTLRRNHASDNIVGILLFNSAENILRSNTADSNDEVGYRLLESGNTNVFMNNKCSDNGVAGSDPAGLCTPQN